VSDLALTAIDLHVSYGQTPALRGVSFAVREREVFGIAGESGSGKTTIAMAALGLLRPPGRVVRGRILLDGVDVLRLSEEALRRLRWRDVAFVPQASLNALNPVLRVEEQIEDAIVAHEGPQGRTALRGRIAGLLDAVALAGSVARRYPHELSGGMRQRVCIAMATALHPRLLIADEPTSALDVIVQRSVVESLVAATERLGASLVVIGHDLALLAQLVDRLMVMRRGRVVELGSARDLYREPTHPYTRALLEAVPAIGNPRLYRTPLAAPDCVAGGRCDGGRSFSEGSATMHDVSPGHLVACESTFTAAIVAG
jgi:oligopeptide/dipeptide ABC transporter ATP-binding protein